MKELKIGDVVTLDNGYKEKITERHLTSRSLGGMTLNEHNERARRKRKAHEYMSYHFGRSGLECAYNALNSINTLLAIDAEYIIQDREELEKASGVLGKMLGEF